MAWTVEDLIASVKRRAFVPTAQATFQTADFLAIANEELQSYVVPLVISQREDYFIAHLDYALTSGVMEYRLPSRAIGSGLREVSIIDSDGQVNNNFPRVARENLTEADKGYYLDGNVLMLIVENPTQVVDIGQTLRMTYYQRPNTLVSSTLTATIATVTHATNTVTLAAAPPVAFTTGVEYDLINGAPGFEALAIDWQASSVGVTMVFADPLPTDLAAGDIIGIAGQSSVPQIPADLHPLLAQRCALKVLEGLGDSEGIDKAAGILARMEADAVKMIAPRTTGSAERIVNWSSPFRNHW